LSEAGSEAERDAGHAEEQIARIVAWFDRQGRSLVFHERPDGRWFAFYPQFGQSIATAPNEEGASQLEAAQAAQAAFLEDQ
jgi:hypothetical protein